MFSIFMLFFLSLNVFVSSILLLFILILVEICGKFNSLVVSFNSIFSVDSIICVDFVVLLFVHFLFDSYFLEYLYHQ